MAFGLQLFIDLRPKAVNQHQPHAQRGEDGDVVHDAGEVRGRDRVAVEPGVGVA